jgi:hypothetical protein
MALTRKQLFGALGLAVGLACLAACETHIPNLESIRDSKLIDRRITETPRQKVMRECQQEANRFRVACTHCHTSEKAEAITSESPALTPVGERAQIMRASPTFGQHQDCSQCHQTKFALNRSAEKLFGPGGSKYGESLSALKIDR